MAKHELQARSDAGDLRANPPSTRTKRRKLLKVSKRCANATTVEVSRQQTLSRSTAPASVGVSQSSQELTRSEVRQACVALHTKLQRDKEGRRQWGKRLKADQFHLSDYQKVLFANSYKAARNESRPIDYLRMSKSCHFTAFAGKPDVLQNMESAVIAEMRLALEEQRKIDGGMDVTSSADWKKELLKAKEQHKKHLAK